LIKLVAD
jgi:alpha-L-fucosidase